MREKIIQIGDAKIDAKGDNFGFSFYALLKNKNGGSKLFMEVVKW